MKINYFILTGVFIAVLFTACEPYTQDDYEEYYVVESYQVVGRQLTEIRLSFTAEADAFYDFELQAVLTAEVQVHLLSRNSQGVIEQSFGYTMDEPGIYLPDGRHTVLPGRTYQVDIRIPETGEEITGTTFTPGAFEILPNVKDTVIYQSTDQLQLTVTESSYPGRQNIFVFNTVSLDPTVENLTPFFRSVYEDEDEEVEFYSKNSSGIINEGNFESNQNGTITLDYPWIGIAFYEDNLLVVNTIDDNVYDFVRSQEVQLGGSTLSPGEIQNVIYNISGGIGVFGSLASDTVKTYVKRNPDF